MVVLEKTSRKLRSASAPSLPCSFTPCARRARRRSRRARRVGVDRRQPRLRALRGLVGEAAGAVLADVEHVAVAVEQVVDDLEEQPELGGERAPRRAARSAAPRPPRAHSRRTPRRARPSSGGAARRGRRAAAQVEPLAADHRERRPDELARDRGVPDRRARAGTPRPAARRRRGSPSPRRTAAQTDGAPRRSASSSSAGRSSWTSENECTSSTAAAAGSRFSTGAPTASPVARQSTGRTRLPPSA